VTLRAEIGVRVYSRRCPAPFLRLGSRAEIAAKMRREDRASRAVPSGRSPVTTESRRTTGPLLAAGVAVREYGWKAGSATLGPTGARHP